MATEAWLKEISLFQGLTPDELEKISAICEEVTYEGHQKIFAEGDAANSIIIVMSGLIRVSKGPKEMEISTTGMGETLGELSFLDTGKRSATVSTMIPTKTLHISNDKLSDLLAKDRNMSERFYRSAAQYMARRLRQTSDILQVTKESDDQKFDEFLKRNFIANI